VEEAQRAIDAAHVEATSAENGVGVVKLMGRFSGKSHLVSLDGSFIWRLLVSLFCRPCYQMSCG